MIPYGMEHPAQLSCDNCDALDTIYTVFDTCCFALYYRHPITQRWVDTTALIKATVHACRACGFGYYDGYTMIEVDKCLTVLRGLYERGVYR